MNRIMLALFALTTLTAAHMVSNRHSFAGTISGEYYELDFDTGIMDTPDYYGPFWVAEFPMSNITIYSSLDPRGFTIELIGGDPYDPDDNIYAYKVDNKHVENLTPTL